MKFRAVYAVEKEHSKEEFLRTLLIKLASHRDAPNDICNATFGEVKESVKEVILCDAHVESDYSASVGYDRQEEYWDKETKYKDGRSYTVDVKKTRTVTDWKPHSGHMSGDAVCAAFNENPARAGYNEHYRIVEVITTIKNKTIVENSDVQVTVGGLETVKRNCAIRVESGIKYPGDHHKDERTYSDVTVKELECYILPYYEVEFTYDGKEYHASGFACGEPNAESELPPNNVDIYGTVNKELKPLKISRLASWIATPVLFVLAIVIAALTYSSWTIVFPLITLAAAITLTVLHKKKRDARLAVLRSENMSQKLDNLKTALSSKAYAELTSEELKLFN